MINLHAQEDAKVQFIQPIISGIVLYTDQRQHRHSAVPQSHRIFV